ncbi:DMT family transporter [Novipirellula sp. SH528]|uniref:DMT family transporter n=1 Tax=Novipirellula sp. SH528 TaxID=3454466 RepID=UPI003F9F5CBD
MPEPTASNRSITNIAPVVASGVLLAVVGTFLFALKSIFIKLAFAAGATPVLLLTLRMLFAFPLYVMVLAYQPNSASHEPLKLSLAARSFGLGFLGYYLASYLDLTGLSYITAQLERLTLFTYPTMVAFLAWMFLGEQINRRIITAIVCTYAGVLLMYGQERMFSSGDDVGYGVILVLGSAFSYSLYVLFAKPTMQRIGSRRFTSLAMIGSTFFVVVHYACTHPISDLFGVAPIVFVYGLILAFVCTVIPSFMINEAILRIGATRTTVIGSVGPVLTMLMAIMVLHEPSSIVHFAGMAIAIFGVSLVARR